MALKSRLVTFTVQIHVNYDDAIEEDLDNKINSLSEKFESMGAMVNLDHIEEEDDDYAWPDEEFD